MKMKDQLVSNIPKTILVTFWTNQIMYVCKLDLIFTLWCDRRDDASSVKPSKQADSYIGSDTDENNSQKVVAKPTATRNLILIRHGQYNLSGRSDKDRSLTELG